MFIGITVAIWRKMSHGWPRIRAGLPVCRAVGDSIFTGKIVKPPVRKKRMSLRAKELFVWQPRHSCSTSVSGGIATALSVIRPPAQARLYSPDSP